MTVLMEVSMNVLCRCGKGERNLEIETDGAFFWFHQLAQRNPSHRRLRLFVGPSGAECLSLTLRYPVGIRECHAYQK